MLFETNFFDEGFIVEKTTILFELRAKNMIQKLNFGMK
jgi:hypothetical protein